MKDKESAVFAQEVSPEELAAVSGGSGESLNESQEYNCTEMVFRFTYVERSRIGEPTEIFSRTVPQR